MTNYIIFSLIKNIMLNLENKFNREKLAFFPSPIQKLNNLSKELEYEIYAKRDDISSGLAFGGNKIRKLEWLIPDAREKNCDTLVSIGGIQSNHTRQVAAVAAATGFKCRLVQEDWANDENGIYDKVGNILLSRMMGAVTELKGKGYSTEEKMSWKDTIEDVKKNGGTPYSIPAGASDHELGGLGYAHFTDEILEQEKEKGIYFDYILTATCTGSTMAGMLVGFNEQDNNRCLIGIDTSDKHQMAFDAVKKISNATAKIIGLNKTYSEKEIIINNDYSGPAYGIPSDTTIDAIKFTARKEGMITDPVYEGKSLDGLIDLCKKKFFTKNSKILYVHLGGAPAVSAYYNYF